MYYIDDQADCSSAFSGSPQGSPVGSASFSFIIDDNVSVGGVDIVHHAMSQSSLFEEVSEGEVQGQVSWSQMSDPCNIGPYFYTPNGESRSISRHLGERSVDWENRCYDIFLRDQEDREAANPYVPPPPMTIAEKCEWLRKREEGNTFMGILIFWAI